MSTAAAVRPSTSAMALPIPANSWRARPPTQKDIPPVPMSTQDSALIIDLMSLLSEKIMAFCIIPAILVGLSARGAYGPGRLRGKPATVALASRLAPAPERLIC